MIVPAIIVLLTLEVTVAPAMGAAPQESEIHVTRIIVEPAGPDVNFTVYYESSLIARVFSMIFGAKVMQPSIEHMFVNFTNVSILSIDSNSGVAKVGVRNVSVPSDDGWYVYNSSSALAVTPDVIEVRNSDGNVVTLNNENTLPVISNRVPLQSVSIGV